MSGTRTGQPALAALEGNTVEERGQCLVERLRATLDIDVAAFLELSTIDGRHHYDSLAITGSSDVVAQWRARVQGFESISIWDPRRPQREEINRFQPGADVDARVLRGKPVYEGYYLPFGLCRERRILAYDGRRFAGWLGVSRHLDRPAFAPAEERRLSDVARWLVPAMCALRPVDDEAPGGDARIVLTPTGRVEVACERARRWLTPPRRAWLTDHVRSIERCDKAGVFALAGAVGHVVRLTGDGKVRYLCMLAPAVAPSIAAPDGEAARDALTQVEREIAVAAAAGLTVAEMAAERQTSANTVKFHLKNVYQKLGVANRVELARAPLD